MARARRTPRWTGLRRLSGQAVWPRALPSLHVAVGVELEARHRVGFRPGGRRAGQWLPHERYIADAAGRGGRQAPGHARHGPWCPARSYSRAPVGEPARSAMLAGFPAFARPVPALPRETVIEFETRRNSGRPASIGDEREWSGGRLRRSRRQPRWKFARAVAGTHGRGASGQSAYGAVIPAEPGTPAIVAGRITKRIPVHFCLPSRRTRTWATSSITRPSPLSGLAP
jgi:hypothetical protein